MEIPNITGMIRFLSCVFLWNRHGQHMPWIIHTYILFYPDDTANRWCRMCGTWHQLLFQKTVMWFLQSPLKNNKSSKRHRNESLSNFHLFVTLFLVGKLSWWSCKGYIKQVWQNTQTGFVSMTDRHTDAVMAYFFIIKLLWLISLQTTAYLHMHRTQIFIGFQMK